MPTQLLRDLVAIDSVNPSLVPGAKGEGEIAAFCAGWMRRQGFDVELQTVTGDRANAIGIIEGAQPGPAMMFCGHIDTVGVDGMSAPFSPEIRGGRLYGRGSQDMKGGVAAMMEAARRAKDTWKSGKLIVACVCDEEYESIGAQALVEKFKADAAVVTEPTDLTIATTHKGFAWISITTRGRAAHGSRPSEGRDAIIMMGRVLARLDALNKDLARRPADPLTGPPSLHASIVSGGREWSSYPDLCELKVERRTVAGEDDALVTREIHEIMRAARHDSVVAGEVESDFEGAFELVTSRPPYALPASHELPQTLTRIARAHQAEGRIAGMSFWTDAAILGDAGIPTVLFGPGGAGLHSVEEYVELSDVETCASALTALALEYRR